MFKLDLCGGSIFKGKNLMRSSFSWLRPNKFIFENSANCAFSVDFQSLVLTTDFLLATFGVMGSPFYDLLSSRLLIGILLFLFAGDMESITC